MHKERLTIKPRLQSVSGRIYVARETGPPIPWPQLILLAVLGTAAIVSCSFLLYATDDDGSKLLAPAPLLSMQSLGIARFVLFLILAHRIFLILFVRPPIDIKIDYQPGSQLKSMGSQVLAGVGRLATFTIQTWTLQTIYFGLVTLATLGYIQPYRQISYLFELLFATSHLVSCVTSYVLVPTMCKQWLKGDFGSIKVSEIPLLGVDQLTVHNFNIVSLHVDAFLSGQKLIIGHWGLALSYASYYAAFAWARCRYVNGQVLFGVLSRRLPSTPSTRRRLQRASRPPSRHRRRSPTSSSTTRSRRSGPTPSTSASRRSSRSTSSASPCCSSGSRRWACPGASPCTRRSATRT